MGTEEKPLQFYMPARFRSKSSTNKQSSDGFVPQQFMAADCYELACEEAIRGYRGLIDLGVCREQARGVLPTCTYSLLWISCNLRSLMHFIGLRDHPRAQWEIRQYAIEMKRLAMQYFPESIKFFDEKRCES